MTTMSRRFRLIPFLPSERDPDISAWTGHFPLPDNAALLRGVGHYPSHTTAIWQSTI